MKTWELLDSAPVPGSGEVLRLYRRHHAFVIRVGAHELMSNRSHGSEEELARLACERIADRPRPAMLIGGLGMGFTVAAAIKWLGPAATICVAELVPAVVTWNLGPLAHLTGAPLSDPRVTVKTEDVAGILRHAPAAFDAVLLDVDNGPEGLTREGNDALYTHDGLRAAFTALRPGGVLAVWSADSNRPFFDRLRDCGFQAEEFEVRARGRRGGCHHTIWLATRAATAPRPPRKRAR
jgi:spermidine synthase